MTPEELRILRARMDITQIDLAKRLGINSQTICNYESGRQPIPKLFEIAVKKIAEEHLASE